MFLATFCHYDPVLDDDYTIVQGMKTFESAIEMIEHIDKIHLWTDNPIKVYKDGKLVFDDFYYMLSDTQQPYPKELGIPSDYVVPSLRPCTCTVPSPMPHNMHCLVCCKPVPS